MMKSLILLIACIVTQYVYADVRVARIFTDNLVLQRNEKIPVWGWADKGEKVTVKFHGTTKTALPDKKGKWMVELGPFPAGGPFVMQINGKNTITIENILIGEVWICAGQSNMQLGVEHTTNAKIDIPAANYPEIRFATLTGHCPSPSAEVRWKGTPSGWQKCTPETVKKFSAVGYYFGLDLYKKLKVPIGLIMTAEGATPLMPWISAKSQFSNPVFKDILKLYKTYQKRNKAYRIKRNAYEEALKKSKTDGTLPPKFPGHFEGYFFDSPGWMYNVRIVPLAPFAIKGIIWYQGENEAIYKRSDTYKDFFPVLIKDWRTLWGKKELPFLYVQLAANGRKLGTAPTESTWAEVRDAQRRTLKLKNTAMVVTTDICSYDLHPPEKIGIAKRLAGAAYSIAYGKKQVYSGPIFKTAVFKNGKTVISFNHKGSGLNVKGEILKGFEVAGPDGKFYQATAKIKKNKVVVHSKKVDNPKSVRYAWAGNPDGNLFNKEGFPASCFETK